MREMQKNQADTITGWERLVWSGGIIFLLFNCSARLGVLFTSSSLPIQILGLLGISLCIVPLFRPSLLKAVLFFFALTFPLYGSFPYSIHIYLFELYLSFLSLMLAVQVYKGGLFIQVGGLLQRVLLLYILLSAGSLLLLPVRNIGWQLVLWDWDVFWNAVYFATPELPLYSVAGVNRLLLFVLAVILLSSCKDAKVLYRVFFAGLLAAAFWASVAGIFEYYELLNLNWFRAVHGDGTRLQSVFANPGWFAEFVSVSIPYILLGFAGPGLQKTKKICLFGILIVCEIAIFLTYSRTGWIINPFILIACWSFYYASKRTDTGQVSWNRVGKIFLTVTVLTPLVSGAGYLLIVQLSNTFDYSTFREKSRIEKRITDMTSPAIRKVILQESVDLVQEKPLFGLGYESFKLHNNILQRVKKLWDTPHNFYLHLLVSGGVAGLFLWGVLIFATLYLLIADLVRNKTYFNIAVILSIVAFHIYGLAQAMQYIPMIWFLIFINIGYAMTLDEDVLPGWIRRRRAVLTWMLLLLVLAGISVYAADFESRRLAAGEKLKIYSLDQEQNRYLGFYPAEQWGDKGIYRWTGSGAVIRLPRAEAFELTYVCAAPDLADRPLVLSVREGAREIDKIFFYRQESITRNYYIPQAKFTDKKLYFHVSRTWNLRKLGAANDSRNLGVAISEVRAFAEVPPQGVGFYHWEVWQGSSLPGKHDDQFIYRWTAREAAFNPQQVESGKYLYFRAGQPGLPGNPLQVQIWQNDSLLNSFQLADTQWHRVTLPPGMDMARPCVIKTGRTWIPKKRGVGEDARTLGVAVAGLTRADRLE